MKTIGVIGGSGVYDIPGLNIIEDKALETPFGQPSSPYKIGELSGVRIAFLPRHGMSHDIPPHKINYRANIFGFKLLGVERVISISAVGGLNPANKPGDIVLLDQIMDMTGGSRHRTFFDGPEVVHVDFTDPYCPQLRQIAINASEKTGIELAKTGTYICVNGPRLESASEIRLYKSWGADVIGMTGEPEATLAREQALCFSAICVITNHAAGISADRLSAVDVVVKMKESSERLKILLRELLSSIPQDRTCPCPDTLSSAKV